MNDMTIPHWQIAKKKKAIEALMIFMESQGTPISKRQANRIVAYEFGLKKREEMNNTDIEFYKQIKNLNPIYFK